MIDIHKNYRELWIPQESLDHMEKENPYKPLISFFGLSKFEPTEHRQFNNAYVIGYIKGRKISLLRIIDILKKKNIPKDEMREIINEAYGHEILREKEETT